MPVYFGKREKVQREHLYPDMSFSVKTTLGLDISIPASVSSAVWKKIFVNIYKCIHINTYFPHLFLKRRFPTYTVTDPESSRLSMAAAFIYFCSSFEGVGFILMRNWNFGETLNILVVG